MVICMKQMQHQITEYKKCSTCSTMFFPLHMNQIYCKTSCCPSYVRMPKTEIKCPVCGQTFLGRKNQVYCSKFCSQKAQYERHHKRKGTKEKPLFGIQNPLGVIENIKINYTKHTEGNFNNTSRDELIWFVQGSGRMGNLTLRELKKRKFKVSDILLHNGYKIENPSQFDKEFKKLIKKLV